MKGVRIPGFGSSVAGHWPLASRLRYRGKKSLIDRQIASLPSHYVDGIGKGEFRSVGIDLVNLLVRHAGLQPRHRVFDLGCGLSRLALHLQGYLDSRGRYHGLDVVREIIEWNRRNVTEQDRRFHYHHQDVANSLYNRGGSEPAELVAFPFADGAFDLAVATSLFTHLQPAAAERYISELARVVGPRARVATTWFLLNEESRRGIESGKSVPALGFEHDGCRVDDPANPDAAIGFEETWVRQQFARHGLRLRKVLYGWWTGTRSGEAYQDLLIASK